MLRCFHGLNPDLLESDCVSRKTAAPIRAYFSFGWGVCAVLTGHRALWTSFCFELAHNHSVKL